MVSNDFALLLLLTVLMCHEERRRQATVQGYPGLHRKTLLQKIKLKINQSNKKNPKEAYRGKPRGKIKSTFPFQVLPVSNVCQASIMSHSLYSFNQNSFWRHSYNFSTPRHIIFFFFCTQTHNRPWLSGGHESQSQLLSLALCIFTCPHPN